MAIDLDKLQETGRLLDLLIACEDVLDASDCYCFMNWLEGEIVEGPIVRRHWVSISLLYPSNRMPDPQACGRLMKLDVKVEYNKVHENGNDYKPLANPESEPEKADSKWFWMIKLTFPRRLLEQMDDQIDFYEDDVDVDQVDDAKDAGIDDESEYYADEQDPGAPDPFAAPAEDE